MIMQRKDGRDAHEYTVQGSELVTDVVKRFLNRDGISPVVLFKIKLGKKLVASQFEVCYVTVYIDVKI